MIKQISIAAVTVAAITGIAYLAYDYLTGNEDGPKKSEDDNTEATDEESTAEPKTTAREELRDELDAIRSANADLQTKSAEFVSSAAEDLADNEMGKLVVGLVKGSMAGLDEKIEKFLASASEYPFDELSDEEVLDVLAEAKEQAEALVQLRKDLDAIMAPVMA